jgi:hypothetical protein
MLVRIVSVMKVNNFDEIVNLKEKARSFILIRFIDDVVTFSHLVRI